MTDIVLNCFLIAATIAALKFLIVKPTVINITQRVEYDEDELLTDIEEVMLKQNAKIREVYVQVGQTQIAMTELLRALGADVDDDDQSSGSRH